MKVNSELSFHFNLRLGKTTNSNELKPIYVRITLNGKRGNFSTKLFAPQEMWSKDVEQLKLKYPEADRINRALTEISSKICEAYKEAKTYKDSISLDDFKYNVFSEGKNIKILNKPEINPKLDWLIDKFIRDLHHKLESRVLSKGSVRSYVSSLAKLQEFLKKYYTSKSFRLTDLSKQIFAEYEAYLIREKKHQKLYLQAN
jgi:Arm DNA-binding domain/Phage integrase SAM-like domain